MDAKKRCFVLMGFGVKVDYKSNRSLDLDKTYKIIKRAVEGAGLECIRADDIVHSGVIDKPMYENLLEADVAIADLSTSNENAIYELGVRHALKPRTTIVIAEKQFKFPFDLEHIVIRHYEHLGTGIDYDEAVRLENELTKAVKTISAGDNVDSPVYTFLPDLAQPTLRVAARPPRRPAAAPAAAAGQPDVHGAARSVPRRAKEGRLPAGEDVRRETAREPQGRSLPDSAARARRPTRAASRTPSTR